MFFQKAELIEPIHVDLAAVPLQVPLTALVKARGIRRKLGHHTQFVIDHTLCDGVGPEAEKEDKKSPLGSTKILKKGAILLASD